MTRGGLRAGHCRTIKLLGRGSYLKNATTPAFGYIVCCAYVLYYQTLKLII